jgi:plastocyanin
MTFKHRYLAMTVLVTLATPAHAQPVTPNWSQAMEVDITLSSYAFSPDSIQLVAGTAYRLHFMNGSAKDHNFSDLKFFAKATVDPADTGKIHVGQVDVPEGESVDVRLIPTEPGRYPFDCSRFLHASFGMKGTVIVQ